MKIDLKHLKLHPGETEQFHIEEPGRNEFLHDIGGRYLENINVDLMVENTDGLLTGKGMLSTVLELTCSRCLEKIRYPLKVDFDITMAENIYKDEFSSEDDIIFFEQGEVDIHPYIEQVIFTEIPFNPLCDINCRGLCPVCGINKNTDQCQCEQDFIDPRWEKLKKFR